MSVGGGSGLLHDTTLADLELAWREREGEAMSLAASAPTTSLALRLYALEIRVKTIICKRLNIGNLPKHCKTHELDELIIFTGLLAELEDTANDGIRRNWDLLAGFAKLQLNRLRYLPGSGLDPAERALILDALDDPTDGVWTWLSRRP